MSCIGVRYWRETSNLHFSKATSGD